MLKIKITLTKPQLKLNRRMITWQAALLALVLVLSVVPRSQADSGNCSGQTITLPFTDVMGNPLFCSIAQIFFQGITLGTTATTYSPGANVTRDQMAAFLARTQNSTLNRGSRRAALNQFWTTTPHYTVTQGAGMLGTTAVLGFNPRQIASDGADLWVANFQSDNVSRVRGSDGKLLENWTGATSTESLLVAMGRVFVAGRTSPGSLYVIDPSQPAGAVTTLSNALGDQPIAIAFDGAKLWTANFIGESVSIITPGSPFTVNNVTGFEDPLGLAYDGANIWVAEFTVPGRLKKLDASGAVIATVTVGNAPLYPIYDGTNIWVPNQGSNSVSVVRPSDGVVLATLTGNGLTGPSGAAFDGQRILVVNSTGNSVSLFRAADFAPLGSFSTGASSVPVGVCSDGLYFWITLTGPDLLARF